MSIRYPEILSSYEGVIPRATETWRSMGLDEKDYTRILFRHPQLLECSATTAGKRYSFLATFFTRKETLEAIVNNVRVIFDPETVVEGKLNYLLKEVCHSSQVIAKSKALSHPFQHIQVRHEFLIRAGLFKRVPYHRLHKQSFTKDPSQVREKYFAPADIVCTNDHEFIRKCTKGLLTLNELVTFEELYKMDIEQRELVKEEEANNKTNSKSNQYQSQSQLEDTDEEDEETSASNSHNNSSAFFNKKDSTEFYY